MPGPARPEAPDATRPAPTTDRALTEANDAARRLAGFNGLDSPRWRQQGTGGSRRFLLDHRNSAMQASLFTVDVGGQRHWFGAMRYQKPGAFDASFIDPQLSELLGRVQFKHVVVLVADRAASIESARLPTDLGLRDYGNGRIPLEKGVNVFVSLTPGATGALGTLAGVLGLDARPVRMIGSASASLASRILGRGRGRPGAADGGAMRLTITLPAATPGLLRSLGNASPIEVRIDRTVLTVEKRGSRLTVKGEQKATVTLAGRTLNLTGTLQGSRQRGRHSLTFNSEVAMRKELKLAGMRVRKVGLSGKVESNGRSSFGLFADVKAPNATRAIRGTLSLATRKQRSFARTNDLELALDGSLSPRDFGIQYQGLDNLALRNPRIGISPGRAGYVSGALRIGRQEFAAVVYARSGRQGRGMALFLESTGGSLKSMLPALEALPIDIPVPHAIAILSTGAMSSVATSSLPTPAQAMLKRLAGTSNSTVTAGRGLTILARLDPNLQKMARALGLPGPVVVRGSLAMKQGSPELSLGLDLPGFQLPGPAAKLVRVKHARFLVSGSKRGLSAGVETGLTLQLPGQKLSLAGALTGRMTTSGAPSFDFTGKLVGRWRDPLGLRGLAFEDMTMTVGLDASGSAQVGFAGKLAIGRLRYQAAGFTKVLLSSGLPVPRALGISIQGNHMALDTPLEIMDSLVAAVGTGPLRAGVKNTPIAQLLDRVSSPGLAATVGATLPLDRFSLRNFKFYLVTPGGSHPGLPELSGMGIQIKGDLYDGQKKLASTDCYVTMDKGLQLKAKVARMQFGPFVMDNATVDILAPIPGVGSGLPRFLVAGGLGLAGFRVNGRASIDRKGMSFAGLLDYTLGKAQVAGSLKPSGDFDLTGSGRVAVASYDLAQASLRLRKSGLSFVASSPFGQVKGGIDSKGKPSLTFDPMSSMAKQTGAAIGNLSNSAIDALGQAIDTIGHNLHSHKTCLGEATQHGKKAGRGLGRTLLKHTNSRIPGLRERLHKSSRRQKDLFIERIMQEIDTTTKGKRRRLLTEGCKRVGTWSTKDKSRRQYCDKLKAGFNDRYNATKRDIRAKLRRL